MKGFVICVTFFIFLPACIWFMYYLSEEQKHRHQLELEKAKQGIYDSKNEDTVKSKFEKILIGVVIFAIVALAFYAFQIPSNFLEYVLSAIK